VLADDLLGPVALDPLRSGVPGGHMSLRVEEEDGIVLHIRDEVLKLLFAGAQSLFRPLLPFDFNLQWSAGRSHSVPSAAYGVALRLTS
jgi:hypothetical protein